MSKTNLSSKGHVEVLENVSRTNTALYRVIYCPAYSPVVALLGDYVDLILRFDFFTTILLLSTSALKYLPFASLKTDSSKKGPIAIQPKQGQ